jgi:hypothetical protein
MMSSGVSAHWPISWMMTARSRSSSFGSKVEFCRMSPRISTAMGTSSASTRR